MQLADQPAPESTPPSAITKARTGTVRNLVTILVTGSVLGALKLQWDAEPGRAKQAEQAAAQAEMLNQLEAKRQLEARLRTRASEASVQMFALAADLDAALSSKRWSDVPTKLALLKAAADPYAELAVTLPETVTALAASRAVAASAESALRARDAVRRASIRLDLGERRQMERDYMQARDRFTEALETINALAAGDLSFAPEHIQLRSRATTQLRAVVPQATRQTKELERQAAAKAKAEAKAAAVYELCGPSPGYAAYSVRHYLLAVAHDPDSVDVKECTDEGMTDHQCWKAICTFRGRNAFGALILTRRVFYIAHNNVIEMR